MKHICNVARLKENNVKETMQATILSNYWGNMARNLP